MFLTCCLTALFEWGTHLIIINVILGGRGQGRKLYPRWKKTNSHLFPWEDESLLLRWYSLLFFNSLFDPFHFVCWFDINFNLENYTKNEKLTDKSITQQPVTIITWKARGKKRETRPKIHNKTPRLFSSEMKPFSVGEISK